jgi:ribosomal protein S4
MRLDSICYTLGFASTITQARQLVNHGHITVNNKIVNIPSFQCRVNDIIRIKQKSTSKKLIETNLDTNITLPEIEQYYSEHEGNFILKENIVKVNYFKIPVKASGLEKIKRLLRSYAYVPKDIEQLKNLCMQNAENFFMNDSTWLFLEDVKKEIPKLRDQPDFNLSQGRVVEFTDDLYYYYLKIKEVKVKNGLSPLNFEKQNIKNFIINKKKTELINQYKVQLLEKAKAEKQFELY